ncbi:hypothetical protein [Stenotrophomonas sp. AB1(2024)]|uniref:hypothetical protein n=1 Tax=Stenotrophomonas sp. AB1(2024) TaxID=3132215 RepID=UPI0030B1C4E1
MSKNTIVNRENEELVMRELAELIASSAHPEDPRLEVAYSIARHLKLGWPSAAREPVVVPDCVGADDANRLYGESFGVDWIYEGRPAAA